MNVCFVLFLQVTFHRHRVYEEAGGNSEHRTRHCQSGRAHHGREAGVQRAGEALSPPPLRLLPRPSAPPSRPCSALLLPDPSEPCLNGSCSLTFSQIRQDLAANGIRVYPQREHDEDPQERTINDRIRVTAAPPPLPIPLTVTTLEL